MPIDAHLQRHFDALKHVRVFVGHRAVGSDVMDGVAAWERAVGVDLPLTHAFIGQDRRPLETIAEFERQALVRDADVAVLQLSPDDVDADTDVDVVLGAYVRCVARLRAERPKLRVLHATPAVSAPTRSIAARAHRLLGRAHASERANLRRLEYADALKADLPRQPVFDLAIAESVRPNGTRELQLVGDRQVPALFPGYARGAEQLNETGKKTIARAFLAALASVR